MPDTPETLLGLLMREVKTENYPALLGCLVISRGAGADHAKRSVCTSAKSGIHDICRLAVHIGWIYDIR